jgi:microcystin-dependent protein
LDSGGQYVIGEASGTENVTLLLSEYPIHNHSIGVYSGQGEAGRPTDHYLASTQAASGGGPGPQLYGAPVALTALNLNVLPAYVGSSQPHENRQPFLAMEYIIALQGIYPSRN